MPKQNSQTTRPVLKAVNDGEYLASSILTHESEVTRELNVFYQNSAGGGEGEPITDWRASQLANHQKLLKSNGSLSDADLVFRYARADVRAGVAEAKGRIRIPHRFYSDLVNMVEGAYGAEYLYIFGLDAARASGLLPVREQLRDVQGRMSDPVRLAMLPAPKTGSLPLDFAAIVEAIKALLDKFEVYLEKRKEQAKVLQAASADRNEALKEHRRIYVNIARVQEGWYRLAGFDELADRLRAFSRGRRPTAPADQSDQSDQADQAGQSDQAEPTVTV